MRRLVAALIGVLLIPSALAQAPQFDIPDAIGFVNDFANVIDDDLEAALNENLLSIQKNLGPEIVVVTLESLQGRTVEEFGLELGRKWGVGSEEKDDGLIILVAPNEREVRIEVGYGLEGIMTDAQASWIVRNVLVPAFRQDDYSGGIVAAIDQIYNSLQGELVIPSDTLPEPESTLGIFVIFYLFFFIVPWFAAIFGRTKRWWPGGLFGAAIGAVLFIAWSMTWLWILGLGVFGLLLDLLVSKNYKSGKRSWWAGGGWGPGGRGSGGSGGFGGFGGGSFGGGGASGGW